MNIFKLLFLQFNFHNITKNIIFRPKYNITTNNNKIKNKQNNNFDYHVFIVNI